MKILGVPLTSFNSPNVLRMIETWRREGAREYIVVTNPHSVMTCLRDSEMRSATCQARLVLADGVGLTLGAWLLGQEAPARVPGPVLMLDLMDLGRTSGMRHYLYGGRDAVLERLAANLQERLPGLIICGSFSPPFRDLTPQEDQLIIQQISAASPHVVWVGLGAPKQEKWMAMHVGRVAAPALIGVGAAFDFHAVTIPWAPSWIRRSGLEWAYRLAHEPRRLLARNLDSPRFIYHVLQQRVLRGRELH